MKKSGTMGVGSKSVIGPMIREQPMAMPEVPSMGAMYKPTSLGVNGLVSPQNLPKVFD